jgi:uncharacterized protein (TIGR02145 family)
MLLVALLPLEGTGGANATGFGNEPANPVWETGTVTDIDGNTYVTVKIGEQWWMAENLRVTKDPSGALIESHAPNNDEGLIPTYGRLYTWDVVMNGATQPGAQGIAPDGWHIPSDAEWDTLFDFLGGDSVAGGRLKETGTAHWDPPNAGATNSSGFSGLPAGSLGEGLGVGGHYWSSTAHGDDAGLPTLHRDYGAVLRLSESKSVAASVRCVKN